MESRGDRRGQWRAVSCCGSGDIPLDCPSPSSLYLELGWLHGTGRTNPSCFHFQVRSRLLSSAASSTFQELTMPWLGDNLVFCHFHQ